MTAITAGELRNWIYMAGLLHYDPAIRSEQRPAPLRRPRGGLGVAKNGCE